MEILIGQVRLSSTIQLKPYRHYLSGERSENHVTRLGADYGTRNTGAHRHLSDPGVRRIPVPVGQMDFFQTTPRYGLHDSMDSALWMS